MKKFWGILPLLVLFFSVSGCLVRPLSPSILEKMLFVPVKETLYVSVFPPPPSGTIVRYELLSADEMVLISGERFFQKEMEFYFPREWHPCYISLQLVLTDSHGVESYRRLISRKQIKIIRD